MKCNPDPLAPHGFNRNASHNEGRYVCECESWDSGFYVFQDGIYDSKGSLLIHCIEYDPNKLLEAINGYGKIKEALTDIADWDVKGDALKNAYDEVYGAGKWDSLTQ